MTKRVMIGILVWLAGALAGPLRAQHEVALCERWVATVDDSLQEVVLSWSAAEDSAVRGYHICTGHPCIDYDTVIGRMDTLYRCIDHSPLQQHFYRLHVFDTSHHASALTPYFGNIVLTTTLAPCDSIVGLSWTAYEGMPTGVARYSIYARQEPIEDDYRLVATKSTNDALRHSLVLRAEAEVAKIKVVAESRDGKLQSQSNRIDVSRIEQGLPEQFGIAEAAYEPSRGQVVLRLDLDPAYPSYPYRLWQSRNGGVFSLIADPLTDTHYTDRSVSYRDSVVEYRLSAVDACGENEQWSATYMVIIPPADPPSMQAPNVLIAGDPDNGTFLPSIKGASDASYSLDIFDRMGRRVYHSAKLGEAWIPSASTPQGVYTYIMQVLFLDRITRTYKGTILLLK